MFDKNVSELTSAEAAAELEHIAAEMAKSDIAYYQDDDPYLTDSQYDLSLIHISEPTRH